MIGGGFGRRAQPDFVVDAVLLSKIVGGGTPVKVIYSREDDVAAGRMRPMTAHKIDVGLDKDGKIVGWKHRVVGESAIGNTNPGRQKKSGGKDVLVMAGSEVPNYGIPNWMAEHVHEKRGARLSAWRGIGVGYTEFASEATIDKLAVAANADPVVFRMDLLNSQKSKNVLEAVADMSDWKASGPARHLVWRSRNCTGRCSPVLRRCRWTAPGRSTSIISGWRSIPVLRSSRTISSRRWNPILSMA